MEAIQGGCVAAALSTTGPPSSESVSVVAVANSRAVTDSSNGTRKSFFTKSLLD